MIKFYNKLIRDNIPEVISKQKQSAVTRVLSEKEFQAALRDKLQEEVGEYLKDQSSEELADILEVLYALAATHGLTTKQLDEIRTAKANERGAFTKRLFLISVDD